MRTPSAIVGLLGLALSLGVAGCESPGTVPGAAPLEAVSDFDMDRYLGRWFVISRYPMTFQDGLVGLTAEYVETTEGRVDAIHMGRKGTLDGEVQMTGGRVYAPDPEKPARLKVEFLAPFAGNYWVIALDPQYRWAVVGEPNRRYLFLLSRTATLDADTEAMIHERITACGYRVERLEHIPQPPGPLPG